MQNSHQLIPMRVHPTSLDHSAKPSKEFLTNISNNRFVSTNSQLTTITETKTIETIKEIPVIIEKYIDRPVVVEKRIEVPVNRPQTVTITRNIPVDRIVEVPVEKTVYVKMDNPETQKKLNESKNNFVDLQRENSRLVSELKKIISERDKLRFENSNLSANRNVHESHYSRTVETVEIENSGLILEMEKKERKINELVEQNKRLKVEFENVQKQKQIVESIFKNTRNEANLNDPRSNQLMSNINHEFSAIGKNNSRSLRENFENEKKAILELLEQEKNKNKVLTIKVVQIEERINKEVIMVSSANVQLENTLKHSNEVIKKLEEKISERNCKNSEIEFNENKIKKMQELAQTSQTNLNEKIKHLMNQNNELNSQIQNLQNQETQIIQTIKIKENVLKEKLQNESEKNEKNQNKLNQKLQNLESRNLILESNIQQLKNTNKILESKNSPINFEEVLRERNQLLEKIENYEIKLKEMERQVEIQERRIVRTLKRNDSQDTFENLETANLNDTGRNQAEILMRNNAIIMEYQLQESNSKAKLLRDKNEKLKRELMFCNFRLVSVLSEFERKLVLKNSGREKTEEF